LDTNVDNGKRFAGFVEAKLEDIEKKIDKMDAKMDKLDDCVHGVRVKVAWLAGTISLLVSILCMIIGNVLSK
jgi:hypothetical protein